MDFNREYSQYAPIAKHIRAHRIERAVVIAEGFANFLAAVWAEIQRPPAPAPIIIDRRRAVRTNVARALQG
jgi:hypothetical protein